VEEDHIIRMGLLASGAAHELGTPLSSIAVILNDWSREPRIADDADMAADLADVRRELSRCKTIVSGILMSAGEVRGIDPAVTDVRAFIEDIAEEWRARSPGEVRLAGDRQCRRQRRGGLTGSGRDGGMAGGRR
jgi:two-component system sensor histidine kinase RegB